MDRLLDAALTEYLRWLYAAPVLTAIFTGAFLTVLAATIVDVTFAFARRITK